ncbi:MAG: hypothetical protein U5L96_06480 [Owenweeksia sp.]|nr:hypothetical protein [Owenweeksia sp.]
MAYASITYLKTNEIVGGGYTDSVGLAQLPSAPAMDSVILSHVNFITRGIGTSQLPPKVLLEPVDFSFEEVAVFPKDKAPVEYIGARRPLRTSGLSAEPGIEVLSFMANESDRARYIKSFRFYVKSKSKGYSPTIKVIFFTNEEGQPGKRLPGETVINLKKSSRGKTEVNLEDRQLLFPKEAVCRHRMGGLY